MCRIVRILRVVRFVTQLRIMMIMIFGSMLQLFWLFCILVGLMYIFAIILTQGATSFLLPQGGTPPELHADFAGAQHYFGTLFKTSYTLFSSMSGGISWMEPANISLAFGSAYFIVFVFFIFFILFSVMNIVTGVFVDGAIQQANSDRSTRMQKQLEEQNDVAEELETLLGSLDTDGDGCLTEQEWISNVKDDKVILSLAMLQINTNQAHEVWNLLDVNCDGVVDISEFVEGMIRIKGPARSIETHQLLLNLDHVRHDIERLNKYMHKLGEHGTLVHALSKFGEMNGLPKGFSLLPGK